MNGIIIINKPKGYTSQDVVSKVKKILNIKKAGHTGTLDPLATGVLPVLLGEYTKLSKYLIEHNKTYIATLKLGQETETGDGEGKIIKEQEVSEKIFEKDNIVSVLNQFLGKKFQTPPMYSAIKVNGKKLYEYARKNQDVEIPKREIEIFSINLININIYEKEISFEVECSKGTYIRTLCEDIAKKLGNIGYMSDLKRIKVDKFNIDKAIDFETLEANKLNPDFMNDNIIKMESLFANYPKITLNKRKQELFLNGVMLTFELKQGLYNIYTLENKYIGFGIIKNNLLKRDIVINE